jgi:hypothetical protein
MKAKYNILFVVTTVILVALLSSSGSNKNIFRERD